MSLRAFFPRIDAADHRQQVQQLADHLKEHPPPRAATPPPLRSVGRPKKKRDAAEALEAAAAAEEQKQHAPSSNKRGKYTSWFSSPYINDVLAAHTRSGFSSRRTIALLQKEAPDDRYERLAHNTISGWFEKDGRTLKQKHQIELEEGRSSVMGHGRCPALLKADGAEQRIVDTLLQMRQAGAPLNSRIIRWVINAVLQDKHPDVLAELELSQSYISRFVRSNPALRFRWRARTTAASKLPNDWEEQGIQMAQRIAAIMHFYQVRNMRIGKHCLQSETSVGSMTCI
jgi:hypothetical protein